MSQVVSPPRSLAGVVDASTSVFPMYVWLCERPGCPGKRIGSSLLRWLKPQTTVKYGPPGKFRAVGFFVASGVADEPVAVRTAAQPTTVPTRPDKRLVGARRKVTTSPLSSQ